MLTIRQKRGWLRSSRMRGFVIVVALLLCAGLIGARYFWSPEQPPTCAGTFDLVLAGAEIIDGLGGPSFAADIGISHQRIACIGTIQPADSQKVIHAEGLSIAPGFIDVHTHIERNVRASSRFLAPNFVRQGVTTIITGNCGRSFLNIGELFKSLETNGAEVNVASFVGHNTIRLKVMHESAATPSREQLAGMKALARSAMGQGALGLSTGLEYIPGTYADTKELVELARVIGEADGLYVSHLRDEGPKGEAAIREAISIGERAVVHVHISHFKVQGPNQWGSAPERLDLVENARTKGLRISVDQYPYLASSTGIVVLETCVNGVCAYSANLEPITYLVIASPPKMPPTVRESIRKRS